MTLHSTLVVEIGLVTLIIWVIHLVRRDRLYSGYGALLIVAFGGAAIVVMIPAVLRLVTALVGALLPASALMMLAVFLILVILVYILSQVSLLSHRISVLTQELALRQVTSRGHDVPRET
jgi:hypothetical protein